VVREPHHRAMAKSDRVRGSVCMVFGNEIGR
jgi:hypothetical protein